MRSFPYAVAGTPQGPVYVAWTEGGIAFLGFQQTELGFLEASSRYLKGFLERDDYSGRDFTTAVEAWFAGKDYTGPIDLRPLSLFQRQVLEATHGIPRGEVRTYAWVATAVGHPRAYRAVGSTMARNPIPLLIPCHRVITSHGKPGNYSGGGAVLKEYLLRLEGVDISVRREKSGSNFVP